MNTCEIKQGDCLDLLRQMPDESINCCITSPPYWGLRDYGTAEWEGGNSQCDHKIPTNEHDPKRGNFSDSGSSHTIRFNREECHKCGAKRKDKQIGLELTPQEYVEKMRMVFSEIKRVIKKDGTLWLNLGDTYSAQRWAKKGETKTPSQPMNGMKDDWRAIAPQKESGLPDKNLVGIPWRVAFALQSDGWYLRQDIIWHKPNPMPESVTDRCTKSHEYIFLLSKEPNYYFDSEAIKEPANFAGKGRGISKNIGLDGITDFGGKKNYDDRNKRSVWTVNTRSYKEAHFATFPTELITPCVIAGCPKSGIILDPFGGSGTTGQVAIENGRNAILLELNPEYVKLAEQRIKTTQPPLFVE